MRVIVIEKRGFFLFLQGDQQQEEEKVQMDEKGCSSSSRGNNGATNRRFAATVDDGGGDLIECSGKYCRSCTAGLIADCVALCCCPCAVLHCFALAFVKAPWVVGRRCLGLGNKNKNKNNKGHKRKCKRGKHDVVDDVVNVAANDDVGVGVVLERSNKEGGLRGGWPDSNSSSVNSGVGGVAASPMDTVNVSAGFEAEKVWMELYQIGHLDFGRVSFSGD